MIPAKEIRLSQRAGNSLDALEESSSPELRTVAKRVHALKPVLLADCLHGEVVGKSAIPAPLRREYGLENLYVEDLPSFWRLLYTVVRADGERILVVLEIVDHRAYSRWFPGRRK